MRHPYAGDQLPEDLRGHDGLVILGGQMGANDDNAYAWLAPTKALVRIGAEQGVPVSALPGHQLAVVVLGGEVVVNPTGAQRGVLLSCLPTRPPTTRFSGRAGRAPLLQRRRRDPGRRRAPGL